MVAVLDDPQTNLSVVGIAKLKIRRYFYLFLQLHEQIGLVKLRNCNVTVTQKQQVDLLELI